MRFIQILTLGFWLLTSCSQAQDLETAPARLPKLKPGEAVATFAGGCFWAQEEGFDQIKGVREVISGYSGGTVANPTYQEVGTDETGHAESVQVYYDPTVVSYRDLLDAFFAGHDPTTLNRQGPDVGRDYRSVAFYRTPTEKQEILTAIQRVNASKHYANPVVTEVVPFSVFYPAEQYHQNYCQLHPKQPYIQHVSLPKVEKLRHAMKGKLKQEG
ncbi:peptide-methionine (S)-S-oxide reductase MsrA [Spirosoma endbachense]|uniref:Peptide methionine sulfoxide reductase MsrA n=1 Tax=Spirosoma endbachense TaxID=2666025 RepID=A0A6P1W442_9BACT|nr:peptide-methionine (S)-S-oxide reductase MsrA [Spirosoma endbachense]QHV99785.1 peptide-methionine (S)-S-oxide reductase MsrA [Spirosoma endbachense]